MGAGKSNDNVNDINGAHDSDADQQHEQLYVKIGEMNPTSNEMDYSGMKWMQQQQNKYQLRQVSNEPEPSMHLQSSQTQLQQQQQQQQQLSQPPHQSSVYENHHRPNDKDMIYAPSANRNIINYMSSNKRFDEV